MDSVVVEAELTELTKRLKRCAYLCHVRMYACIYAYAYACV